MSAARVAAIVAVSVAATIGTGWLARAPYTPAGADQALLRLSWRMRGARVETCRPRTPEELAALPVHMRAPEICEGRNSAYRLIVRVGDGPADTVAIAPAGAKADRPIYVLEERVLAPGPHAVAVAVERVGAERDALELKANILAERGVIALITMNEAGALVLR